MQADMVLEKERILLFETKWQDNNVRVGSKLPAGLVGQCPTPWAGRQHYDEQVCAATKSHVCIHGLYREDVNQSYGNRGTVQSGAGYALRQSIASQGNPIPTSAIRVRMLILTFFQQ
ncbi:hypothetical protein STEG23_032133 [Scotinomys teguina]